MNPLFFLRPAVLLLLSAPSSSFGEILVESLDKEQAAELGITMKSRRNGDAGIKVWIEFKKEGSLEKFRRPRLTQLLTTTIEHRTSAIEVPARFVVLRTP